jgi:ABC-type branched-subunit amino acid transport system ATPase component
MAIEVNNVTVRFGGIVALSDVSLSLSPRRIMAVIGSNGSGKSTLFNSITGLVPVAEGSVLVDGKDMIEVPPHRRIAGGLARTFQTPRFDPHVTVEKAVMCGFYPVARAGFVHSVFHTPKSADEERTIREQCDEILAHFGLHRLRHVAMGELPMGQVRLVEVARSVANKPKYLLLDEPAAGLTRTEQDLLSAEIHKLVETGVGVLLVEHNFNLVRRLSEHVLVLDRGAVLFNGAPDELAGNRAFVDAYLGTSGH